MKQNVRRHPLTPSLAEYNAG